MKALVASERLLLRAGMRSILLDLGEGLTVLEACDFPDALTRANEHPDLGLALLGFSGGGRFGEDAIRRLRACCPALKIIALVPEIVPGEVICAFASGARGCMPETASRQVFLDAVRLVKSGGIYVPRELIRAGGAIVLGSSAPRASRPKGACANSDVKSVRPVGGLTPKQAQVLELMAQGKSNKLIGRELGLAPGTVKAHVASVLRALNVSNRTEAAVAAGDALGMATNPGQVPHPSQMN